jgi:acyl-CoA reductase-like NAD-dependent aldehyde dehydrogenase
VIQEDDQSALEKKLELLRSHSLRKQEIDIEKRLRSSKFSDLMTSNIEALAATLTSEMGKPLQQAK